MPEMGVPELTPSPRPVVGAVTTTVVERKVCSACGYLVNIGLCSFACPNDGDHNGGKTYVLARYEMTEKFLGDF